MRLPLAIALAAAPVLAAPAQHHPFEWVVVEQYHAPSKDRSLILDPSEREGVAPARYVAFDRNRMLWNRELPFTLHHAQVGDDGTVVGWGWSRRWWEERDGRDPEVFVARIGADGEVAMRRELHLGIAHARMLHVPTLAEMSGVTFDPASGRLIARVLHGRVGAARETWHAFDPGREAALALDPFASVCAKLGRDPQSKGVTTVSLGSAAIAGTPLTLAAWISNPRTEGEPREEPSLLVALLDADARPVWTLEERSSGAEAERWTTMRDDADLAWRSGSLANPSYAPCLFSVIDPRTREVTRLFRVEPAFDAPVGWKVRREEVHNRAFGGTWKELARGRRPMEPRWELEKEKLLEMPALELARTGEIVIPRATCITLDAQGRIFALCDEGPSLRAFGADGVELWRAEVPESVWRAGHDVPSFSTHADGTVWIGHGDGHGGRSFARFAAPGRRLRDAEVPAGVNVRIVAGADGAPWRLEQRGLFAMDGSASPLRSIERNAFQRWLHGPTDAVFAQDGSILILVPPNEVSGFDHRWAGLSCHDPDGDPRPHLETPAWVSVRTEVAYDGERVVLAHDGSSGVQIPALVLLDERLPKHQARLVEAGAHVPGKPFFVGKELWVHAGERIARFETPVAD